MKSSDEKSVDVRMQCTLCEQKMNPSVRVYNDHICLRSACYCRMQNLSETAARSIERFLMGNVV